MSLSSNRTMCLVPTGVAAQEELELGMVLLDNPAASGTKLFDIVDYSYSHTKSPTSLSSY